MNSKVKTLIDAWILHKYWSSCCEDEALDWCNHRGDYTLTPEELQEFLEWKHNMDKIKEVIQKCISPSQYKDLDIILLSL